ncbi:uncharacterized protein [Solanum tuberosum]|uniref:uncharacterized protein n=1 Tax=Solanum tuberosum TaxID=4113 RepID=UPI00073A1B55|nr:PREDICTED: uncharacterized protein LOC107062711 [Solanum tuberosum]
MDKVWMFHYDGKWTAQNDKMIINILVNSPIGSVFLGSVNASNESIDSTKMYNLFERTIERIGSKIIVKIVTDNAKAGSMMMDVYPYIYWTSCAAHCINLFSQPNELQINLETLGKEVVNLLISAKFCSDVVRALTICGPLTIVLHLVDGEKKPPMSYIYEAMDKSKETIEWGFPRVKKQYEKVFEIIDAR